MGPEIHMENCTGCGACMQACSEKHFGTKDTAMALIQIREQAEKREMILCTECGKCAEVCPVDAIQRDERGILMIDKKVCAGCGACAEVCPVGLIRILDENIPQKCVRCAACVMSCEHNVFQIPKM